ncbi:MAG: hypothetical protein M3Q99_16515 [Acidobacteriota bacterium]|nr:hypothetical protein [Acidobacteriota bacterium]
MLTVALRDLVCSSVIVGIVLTRDWRSSFDSTIVSHNGEKFDFGFQKTIAF